MLHFFRNIRKQLLGDGKTGKYFKYAVGEILLVVIGILIALQINNWNELRKDQNQLTRAITSLRNDLVKDSLRIHRDLELTKPEVTNDSLLIVKIRDASTTFDTLVHLFQSRFKDYAVARINYNRSTYDNIVSTESFELLPDTIRASLTNYYTFLGYRENISYIVNDLYITRLQNFTQNVVTTTPKSAMSPHLYKILWEDLNPQEFTSQFIGLLSMRRTLWWSYKRELTQVLEQTRNQIDLLNSYLDEN